MNRFMLVFGYVLTFANFAFGLFIIIGSAAFGSPWYLWATGVFNIVSAIIAWSCIHFWKDRLQWRSRGVSSPT